MEAFFLGLSTAEHMTEYLQNHHVLTADGRDMSLAERIKEMYGLGSTHNPENKGKVLLGGRIRPANEGGIGRQVYETTLAGKARIQPVVTGMYPMEIRHPDFVNGKDDYSIEAQEYELYFGKPPDFENQITRIALT